eukprot:UN16123
MKANGKSYIFLKIHTPSHLKIASIFTTFGSLIGTVTTIFDSIFFGRPMVSVMP